MSYISDEVNVRDLFDKEGNFLGASGEHWIDRTLDELGWNEGGRIGGNVVLEKNKFNLTKQKRRMFYGASGKEIFLENVKKFMQKVNIKEDEFKIMISVAMNRGDMIQYANPAGMYYSIKYIKSLILPSKTQIEKEIKQVVNDAEVEGVTTFDIIRYLRFINLYSRIKVHGIDRKPEKLEYKKMVLKKGEEE